MTEIKLPWPKRILWPNGRGHWSTIHKAKKAARAYAFWATKEAKIVAPETHEIALFLEFHPASRRSYDEDNAIAATKALIDGVAEALGVDDSRFRLRPSFHPPRPLGAVIIKLEAIP